MDAAKALAAIRRADEQSLRETTLSRVHPLAHVAVTLIYVVLTLSCPKYSPSTLAAFAAYPLVLGIVGDVPTGLVLGRVACALPFVAFVGIFNPIFDPDGWTSFFCIIIKCALVVSAAVLLICLVGINGVASALETARLPQIITAQLMLTYRYIHVLCEEVVRVLTAHSLRAPGRRGVSLREFGPMCGGLFLRSLNRAETIHAAMLCRGFDGAMPVADRRFSAKDLAYIILWLGFFALARAVNLAQLLGNLIVMGR